MRTAFALLALLLMAQTKPPLVPEGIHVLAHGPETICGVTADSAKEFEKQVRASPNARLYRETDQFVVYEGPQKTSQWAFAKPGYFAYPLATCRSLETEDGAVYMNRLMRCDASRDDCDRAFLEFHSLDEQAKQSVQSKLRD
jgi:hypothetical protein